MAPQPLLEQVAGGCQVAPQLFKEHFLDSDSKRNGIVLMIASVLGVYYGGSIVAICMFLSLIGGLLVTLGTGKKIEA